MTAGVMEVEEEDEDQSDEYDSEEDGDEEIPMDMTFSSPIALLFQSDAMDLGSLCCRRLSLK